LIVIDASACVELLLRTTKGQEVDGHIQTDGESVWAPHVIDPEVMNAFRGLVRGGHVDAAHAQRALDTFARLPLRRVPHDVLWTRMWELRANVSSYDAAYLALAELRGCPLVTCDARLGRAPGHRAQVEVVE
jgi:predicted nucleic acid-binding protein